MPKALLPLIAAATLASAAFAAPASKPSATATSALPAFDSTRAFQYLKEQCSFGPRDPAGQGHALAIPYFLKHFQGLGLQAQKQDFEHTDVADGHKVPLTNIIVT